MQTSEEKDETIMLDIKSNNKNIYVREVKFHYSIEEYLVEARIVEVTDKDDHVQWFQVRDKFTNMLVEDYTITPGDVLRQFHIDKETQNYLTTDECGRFYYEKQSED